MFGSSSTSAATHVISVLFSEPKIPQFVASDRVVAPGRCFSALQRAENSSIIVVELVIRGRAMFQCSSASRKFLNRLLTNNFSLAIISFSALQRAENSSIISLPGDDQPRRPFQCSSASRKFLNPSLPNVTLRRTKVSVLFSEPKIPQSTGNRWCTASRCRFSALQRAENSSMEAKRRFGLLLSAVSVLFSEPKIPQF